MNGCFAAKIQHLDNVSVPDKDPVDPPDAKVPGRASQFVVVGISACIGAKFFVTPTMQHITTFKTCPFHNG